MPGEGKKENKRKCKKAGSCRKIMHGMVRGRGKVQDEEKEDDRKSVEGKMKGEET
jgi:hypothetical protein